MSLVVIVIVSSGDEMLKIPRVENVALTLTVLWGGGTWMNLGITEPVQRCREETCGLCCLPSAGLHCGLSRAQSAFLMGDAAFVFTSVSNMLMTGGSNELVGPE